MLEFGRYAVMIYLHHIVLIVYEKLKIEHLDAKHVLQTM